MASPIRLQSTAAPDNVGPQTLRKGATGMWTLFYKNISINKCHQQNEVSSQAVLQVTDPGGGAFAALLGPLWLGPVGLVGGKLWVGPPWPVSWWRLAALLPALLLALPTALPAALLCSARCSARHCALLATVPCSGLLLCSAALLCCCALLSAPWFMHSLRLFCLCISNVWGLRAGITFNCQNTTKKTNDS